ncbi:unnamed protein product [Trichogramma brassicae]|uniref:Uncharacterized protein n=1 Tax=Trichogramma brassicae TaxID=86971 RepID=A0A6H5ISK2_9HYME|nr:unnamed protein product [Trichogramma brassicae]
MPPITREIRKISRINSDSFNTNLSNLLSAEFNRLSQTSDTALRPLLLPGTGGSPGVGCPDAFVSSITGSLINALNTVAPLTTVVFKERSKPWVSRGIRALMKSRDRAFRAYKRRRSQEAHEVFLKSSDVNLKTSLIWPRAATFRIASLRRLTRELIGEFSRVLACHPVEIRPPCCIFHRKFYVNTMPVCLRRLHRSWTRKLIGFAHSTFFSRSVSEKNRTHSLKENHEIISLKTYTRVNICEGACKKTLRAIIYAFHSDNDKLSRAATLKCTKCERRKGLKV